MCYWVHILRTFSLFVEECVCLVSNANVPLGLPWDPLGLPWDLEEWLSDGSDWTKPVFIIARSVGVLQDLKSPAWNFTWDCLDLTQASAVLASVTLFATLSSLCCGRGQSGLPANMGTNQLLATCRRIAMGWLGIWSRYKQIRRSCPRRARRKTSTLKTGSQVLV